MHYITAKSIIATEKRETLIAVAADERAAKSIQDSFKLWGGQISVKSLIALKSEDVIIPIGMQWIVEADERFQKRVVDDRMKNLVGACAMTFLPNTCDKPNS